MTNAPKSRKTHVIRILGTNKNKDVLSEIWADVERIDESTSRDKAQQGVRQKLVRKFRWRDDPKDTGEYLDPDLEDENPDAYKRKTVLVKVCSPDEEDLNDPSEWIPIRAIKRIRAKRNSQKNNTRQLQYEKLINSDIQQSRTVEKRRIVHYDTSIDDKANKAFQDDPTLKVYVVNGKEYTKLDGSDGTKDTKDTDQYVEHEIATKLHHRGNSVYNGSGGEPNDTGPKGRQKRVTRMRNQYLIDESEPAKLKELGLNDINPPYRLDPFQNIVNIQFKLNEEILVSQSLAGRISQVTKDGEKYEDGFGQVKTAASGLGKTVAIVDWEVVFGKPRDGAPCFIKIGGANIQRGVLDENGNLTWSTVKSIDEDSGAVSLSFAGKAFFVSSNDGDSKAFLYVSFDGETWSRSTTADNPNSGEDGENGQPEGNHVAYNPDTKVWCHTGWFIRAYQYDIVDTDDGRIHHSHASSSNFWSATSTNGTSWTPVYEMSKFYAGVVGGGVQEGTLGAARSCIQSIAYGAGVFVAPSSWVVEYDYFNFAGYLNEIQHIINRIDVCGYAYSTDGISWTNKKLPGAEWDPGVAVFHSNGSGADNRTALQGTSAGIVWCKTGGTDPATEKPKGFFLIIGDEGSSDYGDGREGPFHKKRWTSPDGIEWKLTFSASTPRDQDNALSVHRKNVNPDKVIKV